MLYGTEKKKEKHLDSSFFDFTKSYYTKRIKFFIIFLVNDDLSQLSSITICLVVHPKHSHVFRKMKPEYIMKYMFKFSAKEFFFSFKWFSCFIDFELY